MESLKENGFLNYFGLQRFGTSIVKTSEIGAALIKEEWEKVSFLSIIYLERQENIYLEFNSKIF